MKLCELCILRQPDNSCLKDHKIPIKMKCGSFTPGIEQFCSNPADYAGREQLKQIALYFGLAGKELERVLALSNNPKSSVL